MSALATVSNEDGVAFLESAKVALGRANSMEDVKDWRDKAEAMRTYAMQAKLGFEVQNRAAEVKLRAERRAGELLAEGARDRGRPSKKPSPGEGFSLADFGVSWKQSSNWQRVATLSEDKFECFLADTALAGREITTTGALKLAKQTHLSVVPSPPERIVVPLPEGVFPTITADPPWRYGNTSTRGAAQDHYDTMTIEELCDLDVVREKAAEQSHLYLWATAGHLPEAFKVMEAWGFTYKTYLVWVKPQMGMGNYFRVSTELVLFGTRGDLGTNSKSIMNYFQAPRGKHSAKPQVFHEIVERSSPGPYLELFSRCHAEDVLTGCTCSKCRLGWSVWGNQS